MEPNIKIGNLLCDMKDMLNLHKFSEKVFILLFPPFPVDFLLIGRSTQSKQYCYS